VGCRGECETGESGIELIPDGGAGIVLMDMPGIGGIEAARRIRAAHPDLMGAACCGVAA
jgi:DNA-binding NarL/FixJ family response regulator